MKTRANPAPNAHRLSDPRLEAYLDPPNAHGFRLSDPRLEAYLDPPAMSHPLLNGRALKGHVKTAARSAMDEYLATVRAERHQAVLRMQLSAAGVHAAMIDKLLSDDA